MAINLIGNRKAAGTNGATTTALDTTGAKAIVISAAYFGVSAGGPGITISDSAGNTWAALPERGPQGTVNVRQWYCLAPTTSASHTFTCAGSGAIPVMFVSVWGSTASSLSIGPNNGGTVSGAGAFTVGAVTPTDAPALVINAWGVNGSPTVSAASGWTVLDSQSVVGGTNFGGGVSYQIQSTPTTVANGTQTATFGAGESTASAVMVLMEPPATPTLTLTSPARYEVHQRSGTTGSIQIAGSVTGATEDIEARFNGGAWTTIATAVAAGSFSGTLTGQAQGQGTLEVRKKVTTAAIASVLDVGIGDVFVVGGDSISEGRGTSAQSYTHATLKATCFRQDNAWANANDPVDTGTSAGSHWPLLATQIMASQGVPVAFISVGTGSTDVAGSNNQWAKPNGGYSALTTQVTASTVTSVRGVLMHLGPNAVVNASTLSQATYNAALDTLAANFAADVVGAPKLNLGIFGEVSTGSPPDRTAALNNLRAAIIEALGDNANIKPGPCLIDLDYADGVHPQSNTELQAVAARWWLAINETYYGGSGGRGPRLSTASWNGARNQITVTFDRALKTGLTHATGCWLVTDNGTPMTVSSIAYHGTNPAALILTMSAAATGGAGTSRITFGNGDSTIGLVVPQSADISMPSGAAVTIPAEPFYAATVSEVDVTAPTLSSAAGTGGLGVCSGSVSTNEGNGTLFAVATASATQPSVAQIKAGQDHTGAAALRVVSQAVTAAGAQAIPSGAIGGGAGTRFWHFVHPDNAGNDSNRLSSAGFTVTANATQLVVSVPDAAGVTGVSGVVLSAAAPGAGVTVLQTVSGASFDGSGNLTISITGLGVPVGANRYVVLSKSDGTTTQSPAPFCAQGPVTAS